MVAGSNSQAFFLANIAFNLSIRLSICRKLNSLIFVTPAFHQKLKKWHHSLSKHQHPRQETDTTTSLHQLEANCGSRPNSRGLALSFLYLLKSISHQYYNEAISVPIFGHCQSSPLLQNQSPKHELMPIECCPCYPLKCASYCLYHKKPSSGYRTKGGRQYYFVFHVLSPFFHFQLILTENK